MKLRFDADIIVFTYFKFISKFIKFDERHMHVKNLLGIHKQHNNNFRNNNNKIRKIIYDI